MKITEYDNQNHWEFFKAKPPKKEYVRLIKKVVKEEYSKYPSLIKKSGLKEVVICSHLQVKNNPEIDKFVSVSSTVEGLEKHIYIDTDYYNNIDYIRRSLNHEFWHLFEFNLLEGFYPEDKEWYKLNPKGFKYGSGGQYAYHNEFTNNNHPQQGFLNSYSMLGAEEDKAEIFTHIFTDELRQVLKEYMKTDIKIKKKVKLLLKRIDHSDAYFNSN